MQKKILILFCLGCLYSNQELYNTIIKKMASNNGFWESGYISGANIIFKFIENDEIKIMDTNDQKVQISYLNENNLVQICFKEEVFEYNYHTNQNEYIMKYNDCHPARAYIKIILNEIIPDEIIMIDDSGNLINKGDYLLQPCSQKLCFN